MNTNQYFCYRIKKKIYPCLKMVEVLTNSCKIFKNKTLPARQFHIWEHGSASHILAHKSFHIPRNLTIIPHCSFSLGVQAYVSNCNLWVHVHLKTFPHLKLYLYFSFHIIFYELSYFQEKEFLFILLLW